MSNTPTAVVIGAGPVGATVALRLAEQGRPVRLLTRSGSGPEHPLIERRRADAGDATGLADHLVGASAVFDCMHASAYRADVWRAELPVAEQAVLEAAGKAGAVVVFPESLYAFGRVDGPITETTPRRATSGKPAVRVQLLAAREASSTPTVSIAASDFYGPLVRQAHAGERMLTAVLQGRTLYAVGDPDAAHSWTYVPDFADAMIAAADDEGLWNTFLLAPTTRPLSQRELVSAYAAAAGVPAPKVAGLPGWMLRTLGLVHRDTRELAEMAYQFDRPFVIDSTLSEQRLGLRPTPIEEGVAQTIARAGEIVSNLPSSRAV